MILSLFFLSEWATRDVLTTWTSAYLCWALLTTPKSANDSEHRVSPLRAPGVAPGNGEQKCVCGAPPGSGPSQCKLHIQGRPQGRMWGSGSPLGKGLKPARTIHKVCTKDSDKDPRVTLGVGRGLCGPIAKPGASSFGSGLEELLCSPQSRRGRTLGFPSAWALGAPLWRNHDSGLQRVP